jgi:C4-dicarboxylate transporter DctM subunit
MSPSIVGVLGIAALMVLLMLGTHVGYSMAIVGFVGFVLVGGLSGGLGNLFLVPFSNMNNYYFAVVPLFQLMSEFVGQSGMGTEMYQSARAWFGQFKGGLAMATVAAYSPV